MLSIARARLNQEGLRNCQVRIGDMYRLSFSPDFFDMVTMNSLLRYAEKPKNVLAEAARVLKPGGQILIIDFTAHELSELREEYGHRWLGFSELEMEELILAEELTMIRSDLIKGNTLTVCVWLAEKQAIASP